MSKERAASGGRRFTLRFSEAYSDRRQSVPCGKCAACRLERARQWAVRCSHEAELWRSNVFATLTYSSDALPMEADGSCTLRPADFVNFMKALRKRKAGVRFFQAGEYGSLGRPHHHALLFNCDFPDKRKIAERRGHGIYRSDELEELWPHGFSSFGSVTFESAGYVARYALKKLGKPSLRSVPEYLTMSRRPGIGAGWYQKFGRDVYPSDELVIRGGAITRPPRFYDERLKKEDPICWSLLRDRRAARAGAADPAEREDRRGSEREELARSRVKNFLSRSPSETDRVFDLRRKGRSVPSTILRPHRGPGSEDVW